MGVEASKKPISEKTLLHALGLILVEIRASENQEFSAKLADVFHNVPSQIALGEVPSVIFEDMIVRSTRHGLNKYITNIVEIANKSTSQ